jgi:hypothetical protein
MKKNINQFLIATIACFSIACSDLQENEPSGFKEEFFKTGNEKLLIQRVGDPVQHLRLMLDNQKTWEAHEAATDELVIPTQGGGWDDGGKWRVMHMHEFTSSSPVTLEAWKWAFKGVSKCNSVIKLFKEVGGNKVPKYISQARTLRAYYYWHLIDLFGNVPIVTKVDMTDGISPETSPRKDVYNHIVTELNEVLSDTSFVNSTKT